MSFKSKGDRIAAIIILLCVYGFGCMSTYAFQDFVRWLHIEAERPTPTVMIQTPPVTETLTQTPIYTAIPSTATAIPAVSPTVISTSAVPVKICTSICLFTDVEFTVNPLFVHLTSFEAIELTNLSTKTVLVLRGDFDSADPNFFIHTTAVCMEADEKINIEGSGPYLRITNLSDSGYTYADCMATIPQ